MVKHVKAYTLGDGSQEGISHGPVQNTMQYEKVKTFFRDIEKQGWKVATGGKIDPSPGYFITPTVIDRPPEDSRIVVEEPFGRDSFKYSLKP
jgi:acyl-CoA reductase-like NAD-dependent aldehyde dehydrogenase